MIKFSHLKVYRMIRFYSYDYFQFNEKRLVFIVNKSERIELPDPEGDDISDEAAASMEKSLHDSISTYVVDK